MSRPLGSHVKGGFEVKNYYFIDLLVRERTFLVLLLTGLLASALFYQVHSIAMWLGFIFAGYAAVANDSIQTLGTFIVSNSKRPWYILWLFVALIFIAVVTFSFIYFDGDVTYHRIYNPEKYPDLPQNSMYPQPESFSFVQLAAPLVLLVLTRLRMPVSTTFLLLSCFTIQAKGITDVFTKSLSGYFLAFLLSMFIWVIGYNLIKKYFGQRKHSKKWVIAQWITTGTLWGVWLMQDAANIAVYLPRQLTIGEFIGFAGLIVAGLGLLMYQRGDKIQHIVNEKKRIDDVRAATLIDFSYAIMLIYKLFISTVPLSTTWVFLGIIGGREIAIAIMRKKNGSSHKRHAIKLVARDMVLALIGLVVSAILAIAVNPVLMEELMATIGI
ncbi:MAG: hypothetical protein WED33_04895 [Bacteroidia bacterium]